MIAAMFEYGIETILVVVKGHEVTFGNTTYGPQMASISGLKLDRAGVTREFPDLKEDEQWREKAMERFRAKVRELDSEEAIMDYVISDLRKYGYKPKYKQVAGHRKVAIK